MGRRKDSLLESLMVIASKLPWQVDLTLALVAYLFFHYFVLQPPIIPAALGSNSPGHTLGDAMTRQLVVPCSMFLQCLVPFCFVLGVFIPTTPAAGKPNFIAMCHPTRAARSWRSSRGDISNPSLPNFSGAMATAS